MLQGIARRTGTLVLATSLIAPLGLLLSAARGQESSATTPAAGPKKETKKPRGRLPLYFAKVVTAEQREKIYGIQATYQKEIDALMEQLQDIEKKRDAEVHAVLTPDQQKQVADLMEDARKRRTALRQAGSDDEPTDSREP